jgi:hypothetical protein
LEVTSHVAWSKTKPLEEEPVKLTSEAFDLLVNETYDRFFSGEALQTKLAKTSPAQRNWLLQMRNFSTMVEALRAMKEGDHGHLMYMWKHWSVMAQAMGKLSHYSNISLN